MGMATLLVLFRTPQDPAAFESHYFDVHLPLARRLPGLRSIRVDRAEQQGPEASDYHFVAQLEFGSLEELRAALRSPEGRIAGNDLAQFAREGYRLIALTPVLEAPGADPP
jgi:uncharacterized protein (TIGR02118 family)